MKTSNLLNIFSAYLLLVILSSMLSACQGEDRSGEVPYAPTVATVSATPVSDSCTFVGQVVLSPNSIVSARGFYYGTDSTSVREASSDTADTFAAVADSLTQGTYFVVAYATNGIGTSYGDTLTFTIE